MLLHDRGKPQFHPSQSCQKLSHFRPLKVSPHAHDPKEVTPPCSHTSVTFLLLISGGVAFLEGRITDDQPKKNTTRQATAGASPTSGKIIASPKRARRNRTSSALLICKTPRVFLPIKLDFCEIENRPESQTETGHISATACSSTCIPLRSARWWIFHDCFAGRVVARCGLKIRFARAPRCAQSPMVTRFRGGVIDEYHFKRDESGKLHGRVRSSLAEVGRPSPKPKARDNLSA